MREYKILLAVDGSGNSFAAASLVADLPLPSESVVTALGVATPYFSPDRALLEAALREVVTILETKGLEARSDILYGHPAAELTRYAERVKPDLIVLGAKGLHATLGILLGGVAQQVVEYARSPVLVVRAPYTELKRILLVTDGSSYSDRAAEYLARFPLPKQVRVDVMHVLSPIYVPDTPVILPLGAPVIPPLSTVAQMQAQDEAGRAILDRAVETLSRAHIQATPILEHGDPVTKIIEYARANAVDLIVCGSRGLGSLSGWLLGSVSRKLVHYFDCSVLVVKECADGSE